MKKYLLLVLPFYLFTFLPITAKDYKYQTVAGDAMQTRIYTLDNGLKVYLSVNKEKPRIQTYIGVRTGSKNDPAETTGLAHYLEHLMFKGTKQFGTNNSEAEKVLLDDITNRYEEYRQIKDADLRKQKYHEIDSVSQVAAQYFIPNEYDKLMATIGAEGTNAFTSYDVTCYTEDIPSNEIENWAKIQSDRFQNMVIRGFHTELEAVYEEYNIGLSNDMNKCLEALMAKAFPNHPYGTQTVIGTQDHLKNPSIVNIQNYFKKWYVPNNVAICMAGDFDPDKTIALIDQYFGQWKPGDDVRQPVFSKFQPLTAPVDTTVIGQQAETVWMAWVAEKGASLQCDTLDIIGDILSNGKAGLFDLNLNQSMKVQSANAGLETLQDYSGFFLMGTPKQGQDLKEVRQLMLGEIDRLKRGDFSDDLLPSVVNNKKLNYFRSLDNNRSRVSHFLDAFINGIEWEQEVKKLDRMSGITKEQVVAFANRFFTDGYVTVFKLQGVDSLQKKIDKPAITAIPTNRDQVSQFVKDIQDTKVDPIQPVFLDFKKDLSVSKTKRGLPLLYKKNTTDGLFNLAFRYDFGHEDDNRYDVASGYLNYLGTDKLTAAEVKQQFYKLACNMNVGVGSDAINISLSGLSENMPEALALLEDVLANAKVDQNAYDQYVDLILKDREDAKKDQRTCFDYLYYYAVYGPHNMRRDDMTAEQLRQTNPQVFTDLLKNISRYEHTVLYYGPLSEKELSDVIGKYHKTEKKLAATPQGQPFAMQLTPSNEIWIAPYEAKNIYMRMFHNEGRAWNPEKQGITTLFNEYYGGGMNGIVFQELREARGLAYNAYAIYSRPGRTGETESFFTHIITQNDKMMDCVRQFHEILNNMPQSEAAFQIAKDAAIKQIASQRTTKFSILNAYINAQRLGLDYDIYKKIYDLLPSLRLQDIVDFEQQNMGHKPYRYIILGDEKELDMDAIGKIAPVKRLTLEEIFGY
ncbi:MAG: insulinase family protein [Prevotella sp.]|nr:insulinase family protein [Prevotella sp.]